MPSIEMPTAPASQRGVAIVLGALPPDASFDFALHVLFDVFTHGGIVTGGPPLGVPPQR